jgi:hypothetical protein
VGFNAEARRSGEKGERVTRESNQREKRERKTREKNERVGYSTRILRWKDTSFLGFLRSSAPPR